VERVFNTIASSSAPDDHKLLRAYVVLAANLILFLALARAGYRALTRPRAPPAGRHHRRNSSMTMEKMMDGIEGSDRGSRDSRDSDVRRRSVDPRRRRRLRPGTLHAEPAEHVSSVGGGAPRGDGVREGTPTRRHAIAATLVPWNQGVDSTRSRWRQTFSYCLDRGESINRPTSPATRPPCSSSPSCGSPPYLFSGTRRTSRYVFCSRTPECSGTSCSPGTT
jgi:hypothetical protein